jgi:glycerophosphoryl diester phosphodiesterase
MIKLPQLIGHRGAAAYAPENTLDSIHTAADMGLEWIECDVKLTSDGVPILFHDDTLDRTTNGAGPVSQASLERIRSLDVGSWYGESFGQALVPTLEEAISVLIERGLGLNLEIKPCPGREKETAEAALDILAQYWDDHDKLLISSFQHVSLETAADMAHDWNRGLLTGETFPENWKEMADYLDVSAIIADCNHLTREQAEDIMDGGYALGTYTVNDPQKARLLQSWGVDSMISDCPDVIMDNLFSIH